MSVGKGSSQVKGEAGVVELNCGARRALDGLGSHATLERKGVSDVNRLSGRESMFELLLLLLPPG